jgi:uroporphyrin-III C-methyltransferase
VTDPHTEISKQPSAQEASAPYRASGYPAKPTRSNWQYAGVALGAGALAVGLWQFVQSREQQTRVELELGKRLQAMQTELVKAQSDAVEARAQSARSEQRMIALESKLLEREGSRLQMEEMFKELAKSSDDRALAEVEQALVTADQQLKISGNVSGALIALTGADQRLARLEKIATVDLRRAIAQDSERLQALPQIDRVGLALKIDSLISVVNTLPFINTPNSVASNGTLSTSPANSSAPSVRSAKAQAFVSEGSGSALVNKETTEKSTPTVTPHVEQGWWSRTVGAFGSNVWSELKQLVRIRELEGEPLLLAPSQQYFAHENLKLRLLSARQALLAYDEQSFRADIKASSDMLQKYFDNKSKPTTSALDVLKTLQGTQVAVAVPDINRSLAAVREARARRDRTGR